MLEWLVIGQLLMVITRDILCKRYAKVKMEVLDIETVGIDVSTSWTKFPRYGYLTKFEENIDTANIILKLKNYHINGLEYYDAQYRHHKPAADNTEIWEDWTGRKIYGNTIRNYIFRQKKLIW